MQEILKEWGVGGVVCKLWQQNDAIYRGCAFRDGQPVACAETRVEDGQQRAEDAVDAVARSFGRGPGVWNISNEPITDIVLINKPGQLRDTPGLSSDVQIGPDLWLRSATWDFARLIWRACDAPGVNRGKGADLRAPLYAFVRVRAPRPPDRWDLDERLRLAIGLSRLVHPTSASLEYAVRLTGRIEGRRFEVAPVWLRGSGTQAWTIFPETDYLTADQCREVRLVVEAFLAAPFEKKKRLAKALWYHEYTARTQNVDTRWTLVATALEALLTTDSSQSTRHFTQRIRQAASALDLPPISKKDASGMWRLRGALVHGGDYRSLDDVDFARYRAMENVLRGILRRSILDPAFRAIFDSSASINAAFPVSASPAGQGAGALRRGPRKSSPATAK